MEMQTIELRGVCYTVTSEIVFVIEELNKISTTYAPVTKFLEIPGNGNNHASIDITYLAIPLPPTLENYD